MRLQVNNARLQSKIVKNITKYQCIANNLEQFSLHRRENGIYIFLQNHAQKNVCVQLPQK